MRQPAARSTRMKVFAARSSGMPLKRVPCPEGTRPVIIVDRLGMQIGGWPRGLYPTTYEGFAAQSAARRRRLCWSAPRTCLPIKGPSASGLAITRMEMHQDQRST